MMEEKSQDKKKSLFIRFLPLLTMVALITVIVALGAKVKDEKKRLVEEKSNAVAQERPPVNVVVQELVPAVLRDRLNLPGMVEPWEDLVILAEVRGAVEEVLVKEGDRVQQGDLIARIDSSDYENTLHSIKAAYNLALVNLKRLTGLRKQEIISQSEIDSIKAEVQSLEADMAIAELRLKRCSIRSSISGIVNRLPAKKGLYLAIGDPVATVLDIDRLKVTVGIPEADVDAVRSIESFEMEIEALDSLKITGTRHFLAVAPESQAQVYRLELQVENSVKKILPGMFARVEIVKQEFPAALAIPLFSVVSRDNNHYVYVEKNNVAELREVSLGILDGWQIQITNGLSPGEKVVVVGHRSVDEGQKLNVVKKVTSATEISR